MLSKTRVQDQSFYKSYVTVVLIPFVRAQKEKYDITWFCEDGENVQIDCLKEDAACNELKLNFIEIGKSNQSRTECEQACNAGELFISTNTEIRNILRGKSSFIPVPHLQRQIEAEYKMHETKYSKFHLCIGRFVLKDYV